MKITAIEPFVCDGGLRQFGFLKVTTDEGIVGWSEIYDFTAVASLATAIRIIGQEFIGLDPFRIEWFNERMWYLARPGITERIKVLSALDMALWDIKGKALGVPVYELLGGKFHDRLKLYWSHFASYRGAWPEIVGVRAADDVRRVGRGGPRRRRPGLQGPQDEPDPEGAERPQALVPGLPGRLDHDRYARPGHRMGRHDPRRRRSRHRHQRRRPVRVPDGRHRPARAGHGAVRPLLARSRGPRPGGAAGRPAADHDPLLPRRIALPPRPVPAVLPEPRHGHRDDRDALERGRRDAPDRRDGRALRRHGQPAQLDEPALHDDQRPAVRRAAELRDPGDRHRRRALEDGPADGSRS